MTILRGLAILTALILFAPQHEALAQAGAAHQPQLSYAQPGAVEGVRFGRCPLTCVDWFDGCRTCSCGKGRIDVCAPGPCTGRGRPRCLRRGF